MSTNVIAMRRPEAPSTEPQHLRLLLAGGEWLVRAGIRAILDADAHIDVVGIATDRDAVVRHAARLRPDVVVVTAGLRELPPLAEVARQSRVLLVTESDADDIVLAALRAGAAGAVAKGAEPARLLEAVRTVGAGSVFVAPHIAARLLDQATADHRPDPVMRRRFAHLSERELEVVRLLACGMSNAEIAGELYLSEGTVKTYVTRTLNKLRLRSRVQVVVAAYDAGLVKPRAEARF